MSEPDPKDVVRRGYDALSFRYRGDDDVTSQEYSRWLDTLRGRLPARATVLDIGCGCGVPVARTLVEWGHAVTGIDLSEVQIDRARVLVPSARFLRADAADVSFAASSLDAVVSFYAIIHMPRDEQQELLRRISGWLRPGGWLVVTTGADDWTGTDVGWLGGSTPMYWTHPDAATYRRWIAEAGLTIDGDEFVPEGGGGHQLFWAYKG